MGLLDTDAPLTEDKAAEQIMQEYGFETAPVQEPESLLPDDGTYPEPGPEPDSAIEDLETRPVEEATELDNEFAEAERRLSKAILYRELIKGHFFNGDSELVLEVEAELKDFVKKQYLILSGAGPAPVVTSEVEKDFSPDEITALRELANRILKTPKLLDAPKAPQLQPKPVPKQVAPVPPAPAKKPPVAPAKRPQLQTRKVPEEVVQAKPTVKPAPKPAQKTQQVKKPIPTGPVTLTLPAEKSVIEENGQQYKVHYVDMPNIDEFGIMDGGKIRKMADKATCLLSNGIQVFKDGALIRKVIKSALTSNTNIPGRIPFPSNDQMSTITQNNALEATTRYPTLQSILRIK
jgi:hypothetical protein